MLARYSSVWSSVAIYVNERGCRPGSDLPSRPDRRLLYERIVRFRERLFPKPPTHRRSQNRGPRPVPPTPATCRLSL